MNQPIEGMRGVPSDAKTPSREPPRGEIRAEVRPDSLRAAELRAQEIIDSLGDSADQISEFDLDPRLIPIGWCYQWRRKSVAGKEDPHYMTSLRHKGWSEVPASRHPELMPIGWEGAIEKKGLVLMELPKILVDRAISAEKREALDQRANSEAALYESPPNTGPRDDPKLGNRVRREFVAVPPSDAT